MKKEKVKSEACLQIMEALEAYSEPGCHFQRQWPADWEKNKEKIASE